MVGVRAGVKVEGVGVRVTGATTTLVWSRGARRGHGGSGLDGEPPLPSDWWSWSRCCALPWGRR